MNEEQKYNLYVKQLKELEDTAKSIQDKIAAVSILEKKAMLIVQCCDFDVCEIVWQGKKSYVLYDCQLALYRGGDRCNDINEFLEQYSVVNLKDVVILLSDAILEDYGFDFDKVFDDSVLTYEECYVDDEDDSIQIELSKEQLRAFYTLKLQLGFVGKGNLDSDFIQIMNLACQTIKAQKEIL